MQNHSFNEIIQQSSFLRNCKLDPEHFVLKSYKKDQLLKDRINDIESVGLIVKGLVTVYSIAADGKKVRLSTLYPGDSFGIANLFEPFSLETLLQCQEDSEILFISKKELQEEMQTNFSLTVDYLRLCNRKIHFLLERIELLTMQSARGKFVEYLLTVSDETDRIDPLYSREDIAKLLGISRAALYREISFLRKKGLIRTEGSSIYILNRNVLEQILF